MIVNTFPLRPKCDTMSKDQSWLSKKYIAYEVVSNFWFVSAIWLFFYHIFITDQQVGILDGLAFAAGLIAEVPSGALADRFGRDKMVRFGQILAGTGFLVQAFGSSFVPFFVGQTILMVGAAFVSGADEALFFSRLDFDRAGVDWRKLVTRASQFSLVSSLIGTIIGGWLFTINPRIPWIMTGVAFISSAILVWSVRDTRPERAVQKFSAELLGHLKSIKSGFAQFWTSDFLLYVPIIVSVQGLFYTAGWGLLRPILLIRFHFGPFQSSIVIAASCIITVGILALMHKYADDLSEGRVVVAISIIAAASLLLSLANIGIWGSLVIFVLYAGEHTLYPFMSEVLNKRSSEGQRATILSVASFLRTLPYVILAPLIGYLNTQDHLGLFLISWACLICLSVLIYLTLKNKDVRVNMVQKEIKTEEARMPETLIDQSIV